jgi:hypothetical protein
MSQCNALQIHFLLHRQTAFLGRAGNLLSILCRDLSACIFADLDVIQDALLLLLGYTGTHIRLGIHAITLPLVCALQ